MLNRRFHLLMDKDLWNKIVKYSKVHKISAGEYIRRAVERYLNAKDEEDDRSTRFKGFFQSKSPK